MAYGNKALCRFSRLVGSARPVLYQALAISAFVVTLLHLRSLHHERRTIKEVGLLQ
jgi:hypothetical protein